MAELRWNPIQGQWIIVAAHRRNRPHRPKEWCPFCPGSGKVPDGYDVYAYPNDFPSLMENPPEPDVESSPISPVDTLRGACEVILYSPEHEATLADLHLDHLRKLIDLWRERYETLGSKDFVNYVLIFENRGDVIGVTITHPHGQIYAYPFVPPRPQRELANEEKYWVDRGRCLCCDIIDSEKDNGRRIIVDNPHFIAFVPFFAAYPYEVHLYPKRHLQSLSDLTSEEANSFAKTLKAVVRKYDNLFDMTFPYMMIFSQKPTDGGAYLYHHFRVEFYPPLMDEKNIRYIAGGETGSGVQVNPTDIEAKARELRLGTPEKSE